MSSILFPVACFSRDSLIAAFPVGWSRGVALIAAFPIAASILPSIGMVETATTFCFFSLGFWTTLNTVTSLVAVSSASVFILSDMKNHCAYQMRQVTLDQSMGFLGSGHSWMVWLTQPSHPRGRPTNL